MKNFTTRLVALVVALSLFLIPASAFAAERNAFSASVGNLQLISGEDTITIPVTLQVAGGADVEGGRGYGILNVLSDETTAISALAAVENGEIKAYINGMEYGVTVSIDQLVMMLMPLLSELEGQVGNLMSGELPPELAETVTPELQAAAIRLVNAYIDLMNENTLNPTAYSEAYLNAMGITVTEGAEAETITLFDVEASAVPMTIAMPEMTYIEMIDAMSSASPAMKEYYDAYFDFFNQLMIAVGEEEVNFRDELASVDMKMSMNAKVYVVENGLLAEMVMPITVEGETIEIPMTITALTDENGTYFDIYMTADEPNGEEVMYFNIYVDDYVEEDTDYANFYLSFGVMENAEAEMPYVGLDLSLYAIANAEGSLYAADVAALSDGELVMLSTGYFGYPVVSTEEADSYDGYVFLTVNDGLSNVEAYLDTNLTLTNVPEGELLTLANSLNILEADEAALEKLGQDALMALMQGLGVLMQNPTIAALIGG